VLPLKDNIPTDRFPVVTIALIVANVVVYLLSIRHGGSLWGGPSSLTAFKYGAIPCELSHPGQHLIGTAQGNVCSAHGHGVPHEPGTPFTVLSSMFMHGGLLHIGGNMLFLWIFGNNVEDSMGPVKFLAFYLVGGVAALALQTVVDPNSTVPTVGASGAIAAVLGGYIVLYPRARVITVIFIVIFFTIVEIPAMLVLGFWFLEQAFLGAAGLTHAAGESGGGGVAYFAHIGGFVFGLLTIRALARRVKPVPPRYPVY
jgi:membrane associated rhomboid family serine protease